jgi:peptidyl-prolyl cis-trans isomerase D
MLQTFRNHLLGWFAKILIGLISIAFALFGIQYYLVSSHSKQYVATVNGEKISSEQLTAAYNRNRNRLLSQYGPKYHLTPELQEKLRKDSLNELINFEIIYQGAHKAGFLTSPLAVQAMIEQMPAFQVDGQFSYEQMQRMLYNLSYSEQSFFDEMRRALTVGQLNEGITRSAFALPNEIDRAFEVVEQKRDFNALILALQQFEREVKLSDAMIQSYYDAHRNQYMSEAQVSVDYIMIDINDLKPKIKVTDQDLKNFYQTNPGAFSSPARWQVAKLVVPLEANAKKKEIDEAKERLSLLVDQIKREQQLPASVKTEWITATKENKEVVKLFASMKVGDLSQAQQQEGGWVVYKLLATETPKPQPFENVTAALKEAVIKQKTEQEFTALTDQMAELAFTHPDSLKPVAEPLGVSIKSTGLFTRRGTKDGLESSPKFVSAAFSDEVLQQSSNSNPVDLGNGRVVVLRLKQSQPSHVLPLESVKDEIEGILKRKEAEAQMTKLGESMVQRLRSGQSIDELIKAHQLSWQQRVNVSRRDNSLDQDLIRLAFHQSAPKDKTSSVGGALLPNGNYAIVSVQKVLPADLKNLTKDQRENFKKALIMRYGMWDFNLYVKELKDKAKVVTEKGSRLEM